MRRLVVGVLAGVAFAASFYSASLAVARAGLPALLGSPEAHVEELQRHNATWQGTDGFRPRSVPVVVAQPAIETPAWAGPAWAALAASLGQAVALSVWFVRPGSSRRARGGAATGLMWVGLVPLVVVPLWDSYASLVARRRYWAAAFGEPVGPDPFAPVLPFGAAAGLFAVAVALAPWRGVQLAYAGGGRPSPWP